MPSGPYVGKTKLGIGGVSTGILNIVKTVKEIYIKDITIVKIGKFYQVYGKDAYIISYFFEYRLKSRKSIYVRIFRK